MKVYIYRDSASECHFQFESGELFYLLNSNGVVHIRRIRSPYSHHVVRYEGMTTAEAIHRFCGGKEELVLSFLPLKEKPII